MLRAQKPSPAARRYMSLVVALASLSVASQSLWAQNAPRNPRGQVGAASGSTLEIAKAEGKLEAQQGQTIKISTADKKDAFLVINRQTTLVYSGEADPKWLSPGLMVRFSTQLEQGKPAAALKNLEVFMPVRSPRMTMEQMRDQTPGVYQEGKAPPPGAKGLFADDKDKDKDKKDAKNAGRAETPAATAGSESYRVVGTIRGVHQNTLLISAGAQPVQVDLDPEAVVSVTASDLSFASQGDIVTVSGLRNPAQPDWIQAETIEIKSAKKLTQAQPTPRGGRMRNNARGRGGDAEFGDAQGKATDKAQGDQERVDPNDNPAQGRRPAPGERRVPGRAPNARNPQSQSQ